MKLLQVICGVIVGIRTEYERRRVLSRLLESLVNEGMLDRAVAQQQK